VIDAALQRFKGALDKVGLESGPFTPHLFRSLKAMGGCSIGDCMLIRVCLSSRF
jgi:hypothetical protein